MPANRRQVILANIMLITATIIWGFNFIFQKDASGVVGPLTFIFVRYFLGAITILIFILATEKRKPIEERTPYTKESFRKLFILGCVICIPHVICQFFCQWGIGFTTASKAAFLTATYIVVIPILAFIIFRKKTSLNALLGVVIGVVGLYNLSITGDFHINPGDAFVMIGASFGAFHILMISRLVQSNTNGIHLTCIEFFAGACYSLILALLIEKPTFAQLWECMDSLLFAAILGTGICQMLQVSAQKYTDPTVAALIMSLESLFGAIAGVIFLGETFTAKELFGAAVLTVAVVIAQLNPKPKKASDGSEANETLPEDTR